MGAASQFIKEAAQNTAHPGAIAGRGAQTGNAESAADHGHGATDVWTRTWEGVTQDADKGGDRGAMAAAPAFGVSSPILGKSIATLGMSPGMGLAGRLLGNAAGYTAAVFEAVESAKGLKNGVVDQKWHSSDIGGGAGQQFGNVWDTAKNLFHGGDRPPPKGALGHFGAAVAVMTAAEQALSSLLTSWIPFPAIPAVRVLDLEVGLPHVHAHPPNVPGPGALPSTGPVIPIPYVSGAATVLINGMPAARCGDMGLGVWCGGYFPMFEIFLGSSNVWLEGARAARVGPLTKHCIFSNPRSIVKGGDNPIGSPLGFLVGSSPNVIIGGVPMPSLTAMALGGIFKGLFKALGKLAGMIGKTSAFSRLAAMAKNSKLGQKVQALADDMAKLRKPGQGNLSLLADYIRSRRLVDGMLKEGKLVFEESCSDAFKQAVKDDLYKVGSTKVGREVLGDIRGSNHKVTFEPLRSPEVDPAHQAAGPHALPENGAGSNNPAVGSDTRVRLSPNDPRYKSTGMPTDRTTAHELGHARNNALGRNAQVDPQPPGFDRGRWTDMEEWNNINNVDNPYGREWNLPDRTGHNDMLPDPPPPSPPPAPPGPGGTLPGVGPAP
jgi:uncharacterized Zn-binding protein involved in type VI secretion